MKSAKYKLVDIMSHELAEHFLSEVQGHTADDIRELAEAIQTVCEDHCREVEDRHVLQKEGDRGS